MIGVKFDAYHSWDNWNLVLQSISIGMPEPKTNSVDIPGANGSLDLTETLTGEVVYENRELSFKFETAEQLTGKSWADLISEIATALHGKRMNIILDDDPDWIYNGRCIIDAFSTSVAKQEITIKCDCDPFKTDSDGNESI